MSEHLNKAKASLTKAKDLGSENPVYPELLQIALVQTLISIGESLEKLTANETRVEGPTSDAVLDHLRRSALS